MQTKKYNKNIKAKAQELLSLCFSRDVPLHLLNFKSIVIATVDDQLVGLAGYTTSRLHSKVVTEYICVHPSFRREKLATELHSSLYLNYPLEDFYQGIDMCCYGDDLQAQGFLSSLSFQKTLDCHIAIIDLLHPLEPSTTENVVTLEHLYQDDRYKERVKDFYILKYIQEHQQSPAVELSNSVWDEYYDDGECHKLGLAITRDSHIVGCTFAYPNFGKELEDEADSLMGLGGVYARGNDLEDELGILRALLSTQFSLMKAAGHTEAYLEIDSTEASSDFLLSWLPIIRQEIFMRYQLKLS